MKVLLDFICMRHSGKQGVAGSIPDGELYFHFEFVLTSYCSQLSEAQVNFKG